MSRPIGSRSRGGGSVVSQLELQQLRKTFGRVVAVDSLDLVIDRGELVSLVGPSGCGKTTTLRMVAGLQQVDRGRIFLEGRDVTHDPANRRGMGVVFQSYALFPNMTAAENIAYGLAVRKRPGKDVKRKVDELVELIQIGDGASRYPHQLSGGQQQRGALAAEAVGGAEPAARPPPGAAHGAACPPARRAALGARRRGPTHPPPRD